MRIPVKADTESGGGGQRRRVATQVAELFIRVSAIIQGRTLFAHRFVGRELDAVSVVNEAIEDGVAEVRVPIADR